MAIAKSTKAAQATSAASKPKATEETAVTSYDPVAGIKRIKDQELLLGTEALGSLQERNEAVFAQILRQQAADMGSRIAGVAEFVDIDATKVNEILSITGHDPIALPAAAA